MLENYNVCKLSDKSNLHNFEKSLKEIKVKPNIIINCAGKVGGLNYNITKKRDFLL